MPTGRAPGAESDQAQSGKGKAWEVSGMGLGRGVSGMGLGMGVSGWAWWLARINWWLLTLSLANIFSYDINVVDGLGRLKSAVSDCERGADFDFVDQK